MNKLLLIDLRTPFHVKEFKRLRINFKFFNSFDFLIIAPNKLFIDDIQGKLFRYSVPPTSYISILSLWSLVKSVSIYTLNYKNIFICTAITFGPLHDLIINKIKISGGFLFEDGISSYLNMSVNNYWIKKIFYTLFFFKKINLPKQKFFSVDLDFYNTIFTDKFRHAEEVSGQKKIYKLKPYEKYTFSGHIKYFHIH